MKLDKEWMVKIAVLVLIGYFAIFGIPSIAHSDTVDELAYKYSSNPSGLVNRINVIMPATPKNCRIISEKIYKVLAKGQYTDLKLMGIWSGKRGHAVVMYRDRFGCNVFITTMNNKKAGKYMTVMIRMKTGGIKEFCTLWDSNWDTYIEYDREWRAIKITRR